MKLKIIGLCLLLSGCSFFTNRAKKEVLQDADKELDSLIELQEKDCNSFSQKLRGLKEKVKQEMERLK